MELALDILHGPWECIGEKGHQALHAGLSTSGEALLDTASG